jgi:hypothetical protein
MNQEQVQLTYELITNPILRLLVFFLSGGLAVMGAACIYLYRDREAAYHELLQANSEQTRAMIVLSASLSAVNQKLQELDGIITNHLIQSHEKKNSSGK